jgi:hypothetical protein
MLTLQDDFAMDPPDPWFLGKVTANDGSPLRFGRLRLGVPWVGDVPLRCIVEEHGSVLDLTPTVAYEAVATAATANRLRPLLEPWCEFIPLRVSGFEEREFFVLNVTTLLDALDEELSGVSYLPDAYYKANPHVERLYHQIRKHIFVEERVTAPIFRLRMEPFSLFIRHDAHRLFVEHGINGFACRPMLSV